MDAQLKDLEHRIDEAWKRLDLDRLVAEFEALRVRSLESDFWNDTSSAQNAMKQMSKLEARIVPWQKLKQGISEVVELAKLKDASLVDELSSHQQELEVQFDSLREELKFNGPYDSHDAILSIYAGAGGTDAQDWAQMLFRMYSRYFDKNKWHYIVANESSGDEAGLKSVTLEVNGSFAYGKLSGEHGVHRLVRLSPFNADHLRQTSFAKVEVMPKIDKPEELVIDEQDLKIDVYRSGGHGGQSVNTTDSAVRITHLPTGITVAIQNERSQLQNRETAMTIIRSRLAQLQLEQHRERLEDLKGPSQSAEWGNQIRSYVLHPYKQVKDLRTHYETSDPDEVLNGNLDGLINSYLDYSI
jgi:peptide chain release factor 2